MLVISIFLIAYRHPCMETLGLMHTMKIRYGGGLDSAPGISWRLTLVFALIPWLMKNRPMERPELRHKGGNDDGGVVALSEDAMLSVQPSKHRSSINQK